MKVTMNEEERFYQDLYETDGTYKEREGKRRGIAEVNITFCILIIVHVEVRSRLL